jgi:ABC-type cobalamin transport system permease subunit
MEVGLLELQLIQQIMDLETELMVGMDRVLQGELTIIKSFLPHILTHLVVEEPYQVIY